MSHDVVTCDVDATFRLHTDSLLQTTRSTGHAWSSKAGCSAVISCFYNSSDWCISILAVHSVICSPGGPLSHGSPVVAFFDRGHPRFWNFHSTIPVDVVRVRSYMNCLFAPARVVIRVTINKLYFVPEWLVSSVAGRLWNDGGLSTGESNVSIVLLNSVLRSSSSLSDVHLAASTGNPVNYAIWIDRDPYYYPRSVKEAIYIRLHPSNINRDSGLEIPEAWMLTEQSAVKNSTPQLPCQYLISLWLHSVYWVERRKSVANVTGRRFLCTYSSLVALLKTDPVYHV